MVGMPDTLATVVSHSLEIKHSRFIAHAAPIDTAAAALAFLQQVAIPMPPTTAGPTGTAANTAPVTMANRPAPLADRSWPPSTARASTG